MDMTKAVELLSAEVGALRMEMSDMITLHPKLRALLEKNGLTLNVSLVPVVISEAVVEKETEETPAVVEPAVEISKDNGTSKKDEGIKTNRATKESVH